MSPNDLLLTLVPVVTILVQLLKPLVKALPIGNTDALVQLLAVVLNVAAVLGFAAAFGILTPSTALELVSQAVIQGVGSVGLYHVLVPGQSAPAAPVQVGPVTASSPVEVTVSPPAAPQA